MSQAPNMSEFISGLVSKYPSEWAKCNAPHDDGSFCFKVAQELFLHHGPRWGLNGKRDTSDRSKDVVDFYVGPTDRHVEVYDFIIGHEAPGARIGWLDQTNYDTMGQPGTARFIHPFNGGGYDGPPIGQNPDPEKISVQDALARIALKVGHPLSQEEINQYAKRAMELGWDGGPNVEVSIINQILSEIPDPNPNPVPSSSVPCTVTGPNTLLPVGTKVTIVVEQ